MSLLTELRKSLFNDAPRNRRRKILFESVYVLPSSGDMAVYDLYCLYALFWEEGGGKEAYGYNPATFSNHKREDLISRTFEECLAKVAETLIAEGREALKDEAEQCLDQHLIDPNAVFQWARKAEFVPSLTRFINGGRFGYAEYVQLFAAPFWKEETDWYGGQPWAEISEALMRLDAQFRRGNAIPLMGAVDRVFDIEHNTGTLTSKFKHLKVSKQTLDLRAGFTKSQDFIPHVSSSVKRLIRAEPRQMAEGAEMTLRQRLDS